MLFFTSIKLVVHLLEKAGKKSWKVSKNLRKENQSTITSSTAPGFSE